jgi:hydrogenase maturation protease
MRSGSILVIGYGNDLRGDDAAGRTAADRVAAWGHPAVRVLSLHQLTPELADPLAAAERAIFLDAHLATDDAAVRVRRIHPASDDTGMAHTNEPARVLHLAETAFGHAPEAWWITIPAAEFGFGAPLSPLTERGIADALLTVAPLINLPPVAAAPTRSRGVTPP